VRKSNANNVICGMIRGSSSVQIRGAAHIKLGIVKAIKTFTGLILREYLEMKEKSGITLHSLGSTTERIVFRHAQLTAS